MRETWGAYLRDRTINAVELETSGEAWRIVVPRGLPEHDRRAAQAVADHTARPTPTRVVVALADVNGWELAAVLTPEELEEIQAEMQRAAGVATVATDERGEGTDGR